MGSAEGVLKASARRLGISVVEYLERQASGLRYCCRCKDWHQREAFGSDSSRGDGLARSCRASRKAHYDATYQPAPGPQPGRRYVQARDGDAEQARGRVNHLVSVGVLPDPNSAPCTDCGHVWAEGERRHEYDHHLGYGAEHHEDVEPVCTTCHHARERQRRATVRREAA